MSQFQTQFDEPSASQSTSKLAVASLVSSLIFFCPITTLLGPLLGLIALATMGARKGRVLAVLGVLIGAVFTAGWAWGGMWMYDKGKQVYATMMEGPSTALAAGFGGDVAGFKAGFHGAGATASDADATVFIEALRARYGAYTSCRFDETKAVNPTPGQASAPFPYLITFANGTASAEAEIIFADQSTGQFVSKLGYLVVFDPDQGHLRYPPPPGAP